MTKYQSTEFPIEGKQKIIEESLEFIVPVYDFHNSYVLNDDKKPVNDKFNSHLAIPDFTHEDFHFFVEWFTLFEGLAKERNFGTSSVFTYLEYHFSKCCKTLVMPDIAGKYDVTNMLELGCALTRELFSAEEIPKSQRRFLEAVHTGDREIIIYSIYQICAEMVLACFAFNYVCPISKVWIIDHVLMELPQSVLTTLERIYPSMFELDLEEFTNALKVHWKKRPMWNFNLDAVCFKRKKGADDKNEEDNCFFYFPKMKCACCGERGHSKKWCPIRNVICDICQKRGHLNNMCKYAAKRDKKNDRKVVARKTKKKIDIIFDNIDTKLKSMEKQLTLLQKRLKQLVKDRKKDERRHKKAKKDKRKKKKKEKKAKEKKEKEKKVKEKKEKEAKEKKHKQKKNYFMN